MKQTILISFILILFLSGCNRYAVADIPAKGTFHLSLINNTDIDVYGYEVRYSQEGTRRGGSGGGQYADNSKIKKGDTFTLDFNHVNFLPDKEVSFEITVFTGKHQSEKVTLSSPVTTMVSNLASTYYVEILGENKEELNIN
ncbi:MULTISPECIES: hypothetical protein [Bacillaceae]|uniref:Lipoprotein n=1 Tax=Sutcliffiella horikoshii TaxID=79883 RepID=A0A5D4SX17_9BACI|nr:MULTISPECIES: hypothetical protein [Bacillaceae]TYS67987.1 hypothetical protein FZC75_18485 [Sutcliffiella horikoshii]